MKEGGEGGEAGTARLVGASTESAMYEAPYLPSLQCKHASLRLQDHTRILAAKTLSAAGGGPCRPCKRPKPSCVGRPHRERYQRRI